VASRDDDKGAPTNEKDDAEQDDNCKIPWIRLFEFSQVDDFFRHRYPPLGVLTEMMPTIRANPKNFGTILPKFRPENEKLFPNPLGSLSIIA
jgi:hypothetical protein